MNKKGFILVETIVVILVLCVLLIMLYGGYMNVISAVQRKSYYDNAEYIYKTSLIRDKIIADNFKEYEHYSVYTYCQGSADCESKSDSYFKSLVTNMHVNSIYIIDWNVDDIPSADLSQLEATTQNYIKKIDYSYRDDFRIIVMFEDENSLSKAPKIYQYASLEIGDFLYE